MVKVAEEHRAPSSRARPPGASDALALALALAGAVSPGWAHAGASPAGPVSSSNSGVQPSPSANQIVDVESRADGQDTSIRLRTTQTARFIVHQQERPPRVVID